jgi:hypothetical protein
MQPEAHHWTPGVVRYGEKLAIRLAVELITGMNHPRQDAADIMPDHRNPYATAARNLGAMGVSRAEVLSDLVGMLSLHGVEPIPTVRRALEAGQ